MTSDYWTNRDYFATKLKIAAPEMKKAQLVDLFDLRYNEKTMNNFMWSPSLTPPNYVLPHPCLEQTLGCFTSAGYDTSSESYCRILIDCVITAAKLTYEERSKEPLESNPRTFDPPLRIYPEMDMTVVVDDQREYTRPRNIQITGKANWALGHNRWTESGAGSVFLAVQASSSNLGQAECQLVTYLATMRALRRQRFKRKDFVQGFYSDGSLFRFMAIDSDGSVLASTLYGREHDLPLIFNWVLTMIEAAARSRPTSAERDHHEIEGFREKLFVRFYTPIHVRQAAELELRGGEVYC